MAAVVPDAHDSMRKALDATRLAIRHYAEACRAIQQLPHPSLAASLLDLNIRRLKAMEADLQRKTNPRATTDGLYTNLNVVHAGLLSLADASGRLRHIYRQAMPVEPPVEGWFIDDALEPAPMLGLVEDASRAGLRADDL